MNGNNQFKTPTGEWMTAEQNVTQTQDRLSARTDLKELIRQMLLKGASQQEVQAVIANFKNKFGEATFRGTVEGNAHIIDDQDKA